MSDGLANCLCQLLCCCCIAICLDDQASRARQEEDQRQKAILAQQYQQQQRQREERERIAKLEKKVMDNGTKPQVIYVQQPTLVQQHISVQPQQPIYNPYPQQQQPYPSQGYPQQGYPSQPMMTPQQQGPYQSISSSGGYNYPTADQNSGYIPPNYVPPQQPQGPNQWQTQNQFPQNDVMYQQQQGMQNQYNPQNGIERPPGYQ